MYKRWSQGAWCDGKGLEICTAGFEFELGRAPLVRAWNSRGFTRSPGLTKCAFWRVEFPRIKKKNDQQNPIEQNIKDTWHFVLQEYPPTKIPMESLSYLL